MLLDLPKNVFFKISSMCGFKALIELFYTSKSLQQFMFVCGSLKFMLIRDPKPTLWFYDKILSCQITTETIEHLPPNLMGLSICNGKFNQPLTILPQTLTILMITSASFNQPVDSLPPFLEKLVIDGSSFNQPVNLIHRKLRCLRFKSNKFNQSIKSLPQSLRTVKVRSSSYIFSVDDIPDKIPTVIIQSKGDRHKSELSYLKVSGVVKFTAGNNKKKFY